MSEIFIRSGLAQPLCLPGGLAKYGLPQCFCTPCLHHTAPVECALTLTLGDTRVVAYPQPLHMISQLSLPLDVLLQTWSAVLRKSAALSKTQYIWGVVKVDKVSPGGTVTALVGCCEVGAILGCCHLCSPSQQSRSNHLCSGSLRVHRNRCAEYRPLTPQHLCLSFSNCCTGMRPKSI